MPNNPFAFNTDLTQGPNAAPATLDFSQSLGPAATSALFQGQSPNLGSSFFGGDGFGSLAGAASGAAGVANTLSELGEVGQGNAQENIEGVATGLGAAAGGIVGSFFGLTGPGIAAGSAIGDIAGDPLGKLFTGEKLSTGDSLTLAALTPIPGLGPLTFGAVEIADDLFGGGNARKQQRDGIREAFAQVLGENRTFQGVRGSELKIEHTDNEAKIPENLLAEAVALADPIAEVLAAEFEAVSGGQAEVRQDISALIANAIGTGAIGQKDVINNLLSFVRTLGLEPDGVRQGIANAFRDGNIDRHRLEIYAASFSKLTGDSADSELQKLESLIRAPRRE